MNHYHLVDTDGSSHYFRTEANAHRYLRYLLQAHRKSRGAQVRLTRLSDQATWDFVANHWVLPTTID